MKEHQKFRLIDNSAAFNTVSKQQWKRTELLSKGLLLVSKVVTQWETETCALPSALLHHWLPDEFNAHKFRATMIWHQPSGVNPSPVPVCYCHNSNQLLLLAHSVQKSSFPGRHTPRTLPFGLLFTSGMKHKSLNKKQGPPNLTSRRSVKDSSIRNLCSFVKWESQAFFTMLASSCICLLTKKKVSTNYYFIL